MALAAENGQNFNKIQIFSNMSSNHELKRKIQPPRTRNHQNHRKGPWTPPPPGFRRYIYIYIYIWLMRALPPPPPLSAPPPPPPKGYRGCLDLPPLALETRRRREMEVFEATYETQVSEARYGSLRSTDGSLRSTRGPAPAPSLNNKTPALLQTAFCVHRLVCAPPCVCTAGPTMHTARCARHGGQPPHPP